MVDRPEIDSRFFQLGEEVSLPVGGVGLVQGVLNTLIKEQNNLTLWVGGYSWVYIKEDYGTILVPT